MRLVTRIVSGAALVAACAAGLVVLRTGDPAVMAVKDPARDAGASPAAAPAGDGRGFVGVLIAGEVVNVAARAGGLVTGVRVRLGDEVAAGGVIATLDDRALRDDLAVARGALTAATATRERSALELAEARERRQRWDGVAGDGGVPVVSKEELTALVYKEKYAEQQLASAQAQVAESKARVDSLEHRIDETVVRAPFDGRVAQRYLDAGATVSAGDPIVRLVRDGDLWVRFAVPEEHAGAIARGQAIAVTVDTLDTPLRGVVEKVSPELDPAARVIIGEAAVTVPDALREVPLAGRVARVRSAP